MSTIVHKIIGQSSSGGGAGDQGSPGATGPAGAQGNQGSPGLTGIQGPQGVAGVTGVGVTGPRGNTGAQGIQGSPGVTGMVVTGPAGAQGNQGIQGSPGLTGTVGAQGIQGSPGVTGPAGVAGSNGIAPTGTMSFGGPLTTGGATGGNLFAYIPGITQAGATGGSILLTYNQSINQSQPRSRTINQDFEVLVGATGWNTVYQFRVDGGIAGATGIIQNVRADIFAVRSTPDNNFRGHWNLDQDFFNQSSIPTGILGPAFTSNSSNNGTGVMWAMTLMMSGATGSIQFNASGTTGTYRVFGPVQRIVGLA